MSDETTIKTRPATSSDLNFVRASWFDSWRHGGKTPDCGYDMYRRGASFLIRLLTSRHPVVVTYLEDVPDEIIGWICYEPGVLHYVYVKQAYRRVSIGQQLCALASPSIHTFETRSGKRLLAKIGSRYDPFYLYLIPGDSYGPELVTDPP